MCRSLQIAGCLSLEGQVFFLYFLSLNDFTSVDIHPHSSMAMMFLTTFTSLILQVLHICRR
ncbi:hypothetical protein DFH29DRAFT_197608 [Suillus ampliporus]|nr:hypothetical protein DFH29DRAFT_197608 [Suillus ampliporus]